MAVGDRCTVCALDQKPRRIGEGLLRAGVGFREVAAFTVWWDTLVNTNTGLPYGTGKTTKSAWERHKKDGHFQFEDQKRPTVVMDGQPVLDLDDFVDRMWEDWQKANRGKVPDENRLMKWIELRSKIRGDLSRRQEEKMVLAAMEEAAPEE